jgi:tetratricopeptide (TPR) repeat protein
MGKVLMEFSMIELLYLVYSLLGEGKVDEAWQKINNWEKSEQLSIEENHKYKMFKGSILWATGNLQESLKIAEEHYQNSINQNQTLFAIDAFLLKWSNHFLLGGLDDLWEDLLSYEELLKTIYDDPSSEIRYKLAMIYWFKGYHFNTKNEFDNALNHLKMSLDIYKNIELASVLLPLVLSALGMVYNMKGEVNLSLKTHKESLALSKGSYVIINIINATSYQGIGDVYLQNGELSDAIEYYKKSLKIWEKFPTIMGMAWVGINYYGLINASILNKAPDNAFKYLDYYREYLKVRKISEEYYWYRISKVRILRSSPRIRNRAKVEKILKNLIKAHDKTKLDISFIPEESTLAISELCDFYIEELKLTNDLEVLDDIKPYIERLLSESKRTNSHSQLAHTYLLQGQLALFHMNMGDARKYLIDAQIVAEEHGLQILARTISNEHDKLLEQLEDFELLKQKKLSVSDRIDLTSLDITMSRMQGTKALDPPDLVEEEPILLLIMGEDGAPYFNYSFIEGWDDQDLFSGFMSAFNSFSSELFSKSIDRIKIDENIILLKPVESFMVCYVIKGQSYPALMKLTRFSDAIKWKSEIWDALNKAVKTSEMLELHNPSSLGEIVNEIFK